MTEEAREIAGKDFHEELSSLLSGAKKRVFQLEMLEQYGQPFEKQFIEEFKKESLDTGSLKEKLIANYGFAPDWRGKKVEFSRVHIVSFPLTNFVRYRLEAYKILEGLGEGTSFIEKQKFYQLPRPSGIEVSNFTDVDGAVLLQRNDIDKAKKECRVSGGKLIQDPDVYEKYETFEKRLLGSSIQLEEFVDDPRVKLKLATVHHVCKECGSTEALVVKEWWTRGDEGNIQLFKCVDCGASIREW